MIADVCNHALLKPQTKPFETLWFGKTMLKENHHSQQIRQSGAGVVAVDLADLKSKGIRGIILDLDKTLRPYRFLLFLNPPPVPENIRRWIQYAKQNHFKLFIISNNWNLKNLRKISYDLEVPAIGRAQKPFARRHVENALADMGTSKEQTVIIGNNPFSDGLLGWLNGIETILVPRLKPELH